jgi:hypothetical protein
VPLLKHQRADLWRTQTEYVDSWKAHDLTQNENRSPHAWYEREKRCLMQEM